MPAIGGLDLDEAMLAGPLMREDVVAAPVAEPVRHPVQLLEKLRIPGMDKSPLLESDDPLLSGTAKMPVGFIPLGPVRLAWKSDLGAVFR